MIFLYILATEPKDAQKTRIQWHKKVTIPEPCSLVGITNLFSFFKKKRVLCIANQWVQTFAFLCEPSRVTSLQYITRQPFLPEKRHFTLCSEQCGFPRSGGIIVRHHESICTSLENRWKLHYQIHFCRGWSLQAFLCRI